MPLFKLQRATWSLEITKTSRSFAVSFSTAIPRRHKSKARTLDPLSNSTFPSLSAHRHFQDVPSRNTRQAQARTAFTSTKLYQEQQARQGLASSSSDPPISEKKDDLTTGLSDKPPLVLDEGLGQVDWTTSFHGLSAEAFSPEASETLLAPIPHEDVEVKPDGILYLPEIKYRRILNKAFGPGGWGLAPRGETLVTATAVTREYALVVLGRLVSVARGEQAYFSADGIPTAVEGCKSNAMMRCCKDIGIASELWDPRFIREFMKAHVKEVFVEHQVTKKRKKIFLRKNDTVKYPFKETKFGS